MDIDKYREFYIDRIRDGYYYPDLNSIRTELELYSDVFEFNITFISNGRGYIPVSIKGHNCGCILDCITCITSQKNV